MFDFICIGNALIDSFLELPEDSISINKNNQTNELCLKLGDKIPLKNAQFELGGNACNVSVGLSRLGLKTSLMAEIGDDAFSGRIRKSLADEKVDLTHFKVSHGPASFAVGINYKSDRSLLVHHVERSHDFNFNGIKSKWVYLSSMGEKWRHVYKEVVSFAKHNQIKIAFNPGTKQVSEGVDVLDNIFSDTEVLFLNKEEAERILNSNFQPAKLSNKEYINKLLTKFQIKGARNIVITDGDKGSYALDSRGNIYHQGIREVNVIEKTGAGDGFACGFMSALFHGQSIQTALNWGTINSSSVIGRIGAQAGLLTLEQMQKKL